MDYKLPESKDFSKPFNQCEILLCSSCGSLGNRTYLLQKPRVCHSKRGLMAVNK